MARYTIELCELMTDSDVMPKITQALSKYPIFTPSTNNDLIASLIPTREKLNEKLLNHYKYHEIGFETVGRFIEELEITMCEIMPHYNQLYRSVEMLNVIDDIFGNIDITETFTETRSGNTKTNDSSETTSSASDSSETTSNVNSDSKNVKSETPGGDVVGIVAKDINTIDHADEISWTKNNSSDTAETSGNSSSTANVSGESETDRTESVEHTLTRKGNQGVNTYAHDMIEFRDSIIDVTMQIIEDKRIRELFMLVY